MNLENIKHIFFDLDHTLWDFDKNSALAFAQIFQNHFQNIDALEFMKAYVPINQECWRLYQTDQISHDELKYNRFKHSFDAINVTISDIEIKFISKEYINILPNNNHLIEDTIEVLEHLKSNYKLHIITNGFASVQERKMRNSGLLNYFETIVNSEMAGAKKPQAQIFQTAIDLANANSSNSVMIGDSWEADIVGAMNFDMPAIFFNQENHQIHETDRVKYQLKHIEINTLLEIKNLL